MSCESFRFESKYGDEIKLVVFDTGRVRFSTNNAFSATGHRIGVTDYDDHKTVGLWTKNDHLVTTVTVENHVGRRVEVEEARMRAEVDS
jgi:hypothetical protein